MIAKPALVGIEVRDAIVAVVPGVIEVAVKDVTEVEATDVVGVVATDVASPADAAAVWGEFRVLDGFVVARGGPAVEQAAFEVVAEVEPDDFRAEWDEPEVGRVWSQVELGAPEVALGEFVAGLGDSPVAWGEWVGLRDDCPGEPQGD